jgi:CDP-glucose 4,6-dehydratase
VIGGGDWAPNRIIPDTVRAWSDDQPVLIRSPKATRPWQHVLEPLSGYLHLGERLMNNLDLCGQSFNFGPAADQVFTVDQCLYAMAEHWPFKTFHEPFLVKRESPQFHEAGLLKLNCDKAFHELGWKPALTFKDSVSMTADWYYNFYEHGPGAMLELTRKQLAGFCDAARSAGLTWIN